MSDQTPGSAGQPPKLPLKRTKGPRLGNQHDGPDSFTKTPGPIPTRKGKRVPSQDGGKDATGGGETAGTQTPEGKIQQAHASGAQTKDTNPATEKQLVNKWQDRITTAVKYRDRKAEEEGWNRFIREYKGKYDVTVGNIEVPPINEVFAYVQTSAAFLNYKSPHISVNARKDASIQSSHILETALNYEFVRLSIKRELSLELIDGHLVGHAWNKNGISVDTTTVDNTPVITDESLYANRVSWKDMVFNIGSINAPYDCVWMAQRIIKPLSTIKASYPAAAQMKGGPHPNLKEDEFKNTVFKDDIEFAAMWEIWDKESHQIYLIGDGYDRLLKPAQAWPDYIRDFPYRMLCFDRVPDESYPVSMIKTWEPQILESIKLMTMGLNHVKRWNRQLLVLQGAMDEGELDKFEKGTDGAIIFTKKPPNECAQPLAYAPLPPDIYTLLDRLDAIKRAINGQPELQRGGETQTQTRTLGELRLIAGGAQGRNDKKIDSFEMHMEEIARDLVGHMQEHFDVPRYVKITGETPQSIIQAFGDHYDPQTGMLRYDKNDIQGEYDVSIKAGSSLPLDKNARMQVLNQVLQMASQMAQAPSIPPFVAVIVKELLREYDIKELDLAFEQQEQSQQQTMQVQQQAQQVQQGKVEAETAKRAAQAKQIQADTIIKAGGALQRVFHGLPADAQPQHLLQMASAGGPPDINAGGEE